MGWIESEELGWDDYLEKVEEGGEGCGECMALFQGEKGEESGGAAGEMDASSVGGKFAAIVLRVVF